MMKVQKVNRNIIILIALIPIVLILITGSHRNGIVPKEEVITLGVKSVVNEDKQLTAKTLKVYGRNININENFLVSDCWYDLEADGGTTTLSFYKKEDNVVSNLKTVIISKSKLDKEEEWYRYKGLYVFEYNHTDSILQYEQVILD